jgi:putative PIN family toxin of toxin-antitoxin system
MRVVLDTNILVSALISEAGKPATIYDAWQAGKFTLLTCPELLEELYATLEKPKVRELIKPHKSGRLVNQIRRLAEEIAPLPKVRRSADPNDDFLLALAEAGNADYLVTGDKCGLLSLLRHNSTQIVSAGGFPLLVTSR